MAGETKSVERQAGPARAHSKVSRIDSNADGGPFYRKSAPTTNLKEAEKEKYASWARDCLKQGCFGFMAKERLAEYLEKVDAIKQAVDGGVRNCRKVEKLGGKLAAINSEYGVNAKDHFDTLAAVFSIHVPTMAAVEELGPVEAFRLLRKFDEHPYIAMSAGGTGSLIPEVPIAIFASLYGEEKTFAVAVNVLGVEETLKGFARAYGLEETKKIAREAGVGV